MDRPRVDLPAHAWRALHSGFTDWMIGAPEPIREAMLNRLDGQVRAIPFVLQVLNLGRLDVFAQVSDEDEVRLGLRVPTIDGREGWVLFTISGREAGVDAAWLRAAGSARLDEELADLLGSVRDD